MHFIIIYYRLTFYAIYDIISDLLLMEKVLLGFYFLTLNNTICNISEDAFDLSLIRLPTFEQLF
jgi:hypothetical protein